VAGFCEHDNEPSDSIREEIFIDKLSNSSLLKENSASWNLLVFKLRYIADSPRSQICSSRFCFFAEILSR
jgi:hypothetical protein